jgi:ABC-type Fe3+-hydroxamate transport system substrate-binding protein
MQKQIFTDQMGREIEINFPPKRIISLVPSQTELLFDLGLSIEIIGITKFCIHPKVKFKLTTKIGGTKKLDIEKIKSLKPDLIIGNKEENEQQQIEELMKHFPVWMSDIINLSDANQMIEKVGELVNREKEALIISSQIKIDFANLRANLKDISPKTTAYFIWKNPNMIAGNQTFINEMLPFCGLKNVLELNRYPEINDEELKKLKPEVVLLSSEPYPFKAKHIEEFKSIWPNAKVKLVDGEMFSWYGSRLLKAGDYFKNLNKDLFS